MSGSICVVLNAVALGIGVTVFLLAPGQHLAILGGLLALSVVMSTDYTLVGTPSVPVPARGFTLLCGRSGDSPGKNMSTVRNRTSFR